MSASSHPLASVCLDSVPCWKKSQQLPGRLSAELVLPSRPPASRLRHCLSWANGSPLLQAASFGTAVRTYPLRCLPQSHCRSGRSLLHLRSCELVHRANAEDADRAEVACRPRRSPTVIISCRALPFYVRDSQAMDGVTARLSHQRVAPSRSPRHCDAIVAAQVSVPHLMLSPE